MKPLEQWTKEELIAALLAAPIPLTFFDQEEEQYQDPDYTAWYNEHVAPLLEAKQGKTL